MKRIITCTIFSLMISSTALANCNLDELPIEKTPTTVFDELNIKRTTNAVGSDYFIVPFRGSTLCDELDSAKGNLFFIDDTLVQVELTASSGYSMLFTEAEKHFGTPLRYVKKENGLIDERNHSNLWDHKNVWVTYSLSKTSQNSNEKLVITSKSQDLTHKLTEYSTSKE